VGRGAVSVTSGLLVGGVRIRIALDEDPVRALSRYRTAYAYGTGHP
jgi:hypothetical protein